MNEVEGYKQPQGNQLAIGPRNFHEGQTHPVQLKWLVSKLPFTVLVSSGLPSASLDMSGEYTIQIHSLHVSLRSLYGAIDEYLDF